jgi:hypothetical protein
MFDFSDSYDTYIFIILTSIFAITAYIILVKGLNHRLPIINNYIHYSIIFKLVLAGFLKPMYSLFYRHMLCKLYISLLYHIDYFYHHQHWALFPLIVWFNFYIFLKSFGLNNQRSSPFIIGIKDVITIFAKPDFLRIILGSLSLS